MRSAYLLYMYSVQGSALFDEINVFVIYIVLHGSALFDEINVFVIYVIHDNIYNRADPCIEYIYNRAQPCTEYIYNRAQPCTEYI